jgi:hypothetical protein
MELIEKLRAPVGGVRHLLEPQEQDHDRGRA